MKKRSPLPNILLIVFLASLSSGFLMNLYLKSHMAVNSVTVAPSNTLCGLSSIMLGTLFLLPTKLQRSFFEQSWFWQRVDIILYFIKRIRIPALLFVIGGIIMMVIAIQTMTQ